MIEINVPEVINAVGVAVVGILTAWQSRTARKVRDLETRLGVVEAERDRFRRLFRIAVRHIRAWMAWALKHAPDIPTPQMPPELVDEV